MEDEFRETVLRKLNSLHDAVNWGDAQIAELLRRTPRPHKMRKVVTIITNANGDFLYMPDTQPQALVNAANPAAATRALEVIDIAGGTTLPTVAVTAGNAALVAIVAATALNLSNQFVFAVYPIDQQNETNDQVTVTATLPDGATLEYQYTISGTGETMTADASSSVGGWTNAPVVPTTPV